MESIYYVMTFLCHRNCPHCYEDRFHPYYGEDLEAVVGESRANFARIIANLPDSMGFAPAGDDGPRKRGRVILAGGEILLDPVRESVLYAGLDLLWRKYGAGVQLVVQTTGDLLTGRIVGELLEHHVELISVSGIDSYHAGLEKAESREALQDKLRRIFGEHGVAEAPADPSKLHHFRPFYHLFGANPGSWIGKLWPRGRAFENGLSTAGLEDNFCNGWSGGRNFLEFGREGAEVSVDPQGNVYPCCPKTRLAIGNLLEERLESILGRLRGNPVYEAINAGEPQRMGLQHGWTEEYFRERSRLASGYANLCIGCDAFHNEVLARKALVQIVPTSTLD